MQNPPLSLAPVTPFLPSFLTSNFLLSLFSLCSPASSPPFSCGPLPSSSSHIVSKTSYTSYVPILSLNTSLYHLTSLFVSLLLKSDFFLSFHWPTSWPLISHSFHVSGSTVSPFLPFPFRHLISVYAGRGITFGHFFFSSVYSSFTCNSHAYICKEIYNKSLAHIIIETDTSQDL